jgi:hypothetical protein
MELSHQEEMKNAEMPDPSDRLGLLLPGLSWIGPI